LVLRPDPAGENANPNRVVEVFNLGGYLHSGDRQKIDENLANLQKIIYETIEEFRGPGGKQPSLAMRFHSGASLLVATGTPVEVEVARKVILALPDASASRAQDPRADRQAFLRRYGMMPSGETPGPEFPPPPQGAPVPREGIPPQPQR
jgi:hypothetical protein